LPSPTDSFLRAYVEQMGIVKVLLHEDDYDVDEEQGMLLIGLSNLANSLVHGFVVGGDYSRSSVNNELGARTQLAGGITGLVVVIVVIFFTSLLSNPTHIVLAAIILVAVASLVNISGFKRTLYISRPEFAIAMTVIFSVTLLGLLPAIFIWIVLSTSGLVRKLYHPHTAILGEVPGSDEFV